MTLTLTFANRKVLYKGKLGKNRKEKKYENEKQNIRHQRDRTINWQHVSMLDRTQRPGQTRHQHSLRYKCIYSGDI